MVGMGVTLNKDGTPRKIGSGKTKGAGCYAKITLKELSKLIKDDTEISVNRVWLRSILEESKAKGVALELKPPEVKPEYKEPIPLPKLKKKEEPPVAPNLEEESLEEEEYEPPPLFASDTVVRNY